MIRFFSTLRQKLSSENPSNRRADRLSKYLVYATGEIVLVMIGILLALQVNNWNELRKEKGHEIKILVALRNGFLQDMEEIESNLTNYKIAVKASDLVVQHLQSNAQYHDFLAVHLAQTIGMDAFIPQKAAYQTLKSKGVDLISNDSLRSQILYVHDFLYDFLIENHKGIYLKPEYLIQAYSKRFKQAIPITDQNRRLYNNTFVPNDYRALREDSEFLSLLRSNRNQKIESITVTERAVLPVLHDVIEQIEQELKINQYD